jgi:hypothetical protein
MPQDEPKNEGHDFDVVMVHGKTDDGEGTKVLRARPGRIDAGEMRPLKDGKPIVGPGDVVRLEKRPESPALYDVHVEHAIEAARAADGPAQVATKAYRESWERTFGGSPPRRDQAPN